MKNEIENLSDNIQNMQNDFEDRFDDMSGKLDDLSVQSIALEETNETVRQLADDTDVLHKRVLILIKLVSKIKSV